MDKRNMKEIRDGLLQQLSRYQYELDQDFSDLVSQILDVFGDTEDQMITVLRKSTRTSDKVTPVYAIKRGDKSGKFYMMVGSMHNNVDDPVQYYEVLDPYCEV